jgi:hypothetical protein
MSNEAIRYTLVESVGDGDDTKYWFHQIGWIGYHFAQLEWASYWLAEEVGTEQQKSAIVGKSFVSRCRYAKEHLTPNVPNRELGDKWSEFFDALIDSAATRNAILHNPLEPNMHDLANQGVRLDQGIRLLRARGRKILGLGDVQHYNYCLVELNHTMLNLMNRTKARID